MNSSEKLNILMVDDQPGKLLTYEAILEELGENLIKASSGKEALECLLKNEIAIVLMDVSMPEIDGFQLAEMIRQHPRFQETAIIFISAIHLSDLDRIQGYKRGAVDYISVPIIPEILRARVSIFAELYRKSRQLENLNDELRSLTRSLISAQDQERRRIARELHDGLGQELAASKMMVDGILRADRTEQWKREAVTEASAFIDSAIQQVRSLSHLLHPPLLDDLGLHSALNHYVSGFTSRCGIQSVVETDPAEFPRLSQEMETAIFRIVQEALTNVFRHSGASRANVSLSAIKNKVVLRVQDDGKGVDEDIADLKVGKVGIGIGGMRQRAKEFGGDVRIQNARPGMLLEVVLPFDDGSMHSARSNGSAI